MDSNTNNGWASADPKRDLRGPPDKRLYGFDDHCRDAVANFKADGCAVAIVVNGKMVFAKGFGAPEAASLNPWNQRASVSATSIDPDTPIELGRACEGILGVAIASMVQSKAVDWSTTVQSLIPSFSLPNQNQHLAQIATVSDLLSHRAGIPSTADTLSNLISDIAATDAMPAAISAVNQPRLNTTFRGTREYSLLTAPIAAHVSSIVSKKPIEILIQETVFAPIGASRASGFNALGREDSTLGMTSSARDLGRLASALLDGWGPLSKDTLEGMWSPVGAVASSACCDFSNNSGGHRVGNGGWIESVFRGVRKVGFGGFSAQSAVEVALFPNDGFGIAIVCNKPCYLAAALVNVAAEFLLEVQPGPWVPHMEVRNFPVAVLAPSITDLLGSNIKCDPLPRSASYYTGTYTCGLVPYLAFKVSLAEGELQIQFLSGHNDALQRKAPLIHIQNGKSSVGHIKFLHVLATGLFYAAADNLLPLQMRLHASGSSCGFLFENGPGGSIETMVYLNQITTTKDNGTHFHKSVEYQQPGNLLAPPTTIIAIKKPPSTIRPSVSEPPPALPPRRSPSSTSAPVSQNGSSNYQNTSPQPPPLIPLERQASGIPPALPPRSRQASSASAANMVQPAQTAPSSVPLSPPPSYDTSGVLGRLLVRQTQGENSVETSPVVEESQADDRAEIDDLDELENAMNEIDNVMADLDIMASNSKVSAVQKQVDEVCMATDVQFVQLSCRKFGTLMVVNVMTDNIAKVVQRGENLEHLQNKTEDLQQSAMQFKKGASAVRKEMWWKDMKTKMILGGVLGVVVLIIICESSGIQSVMGAAD
ncbi:Penicillin-binding protein 1C [Chytriomyces hyalinus]|nr:Penicillin-binding protein 1C [Chytriomyces hyalinus]